MTKVSKNFFNLMLYLNHNLVKEKNRKNKSMFINQLTSKLKFTLNL